MDQLADERRRGGGGGGGGDGGDGTYCSKHPYRSNIGGGICAFCLQEKLGKLVSSSASSSFILPGRTSTSSPGDDSSSPPSSDLSLSSSNRDPNTYNCNRSGRGSGSGHTRRAKIPGFLYSKKKKKKNKGDPSSVSSDRATEFASFMRSNTAPRRQGHLGGFLDGDQGDVLEDSPRKKGFWSFLYLSGSSQPSSSTSSTVATSKHPNGTPRAALSSSSSVVMPGRRAERMTLFSDGSKRCANVIPEDDDVDCSNCNNNNNFERKVSRSRSVGCGSRSFSGDLFERISTGFGDCTLRRVESQREPNGHGHIHPLGPSEPRASSADPEYSMKERVRCGGIFGGFMMASSSSSSYWITSTSSEDHRNNGSNRSRHSSTAAAAVIHSRHRSWGWSFASPMRAFIPPSSKDGKIGKSSTATPNLNPIPSLLAVRG